MDGGAWWAVAHRVTKSRDMTERLHFHFSLSCIGEGNGNPLQCSCLENPRDGGAWWAAVYGVTQRWTRLKRLSSSSSTNNNSNMLPSPVLIFTKITGSSQFKYYWLTVLVTKSWTVPTRLLYPRDFPDKSPGVGCHFLPHTVATPCKMWRNKLRALWWLFWKHKAGKGKF